MIRLACAVIAALVVGLFSSTPAADTSHTETPTAVAYNYDGTQHAAAPNQAKGERGPPAEVLTDSMYNAVDRWSHGTSGRPKGSTSGATTTYNTPDELARDTVAARMTRVPTLADVGGLSSIRRSDVAANGGVRATRQAYVDSARAILDDGLARVAGGGAPEAVARSVVESRNALKLEARQNMPGPLNKWAEWRNTRRYGNPVGPTYEGLISRPGATDIGIIQRAGNTSGWINWLLGVR